MKKEQINKLVDDALSSTDNIKRASPMPFLLTRVQARMNGTKENIWEKAVRFIGRPVFAIPAVAAVILVNITVIVFNRESLFGTSAEIQLPADDYSYSVATIYDIENTEP